MRKILFTLACALTLTFTSCFNDEPGSYSEFWQYVTIDTTSNPVKFYGFYMGEEYSGFTNLRTPEQLAFFNLENVSLALIKMRLETDAAYKQTLTLMQAQKIETESITNIIPTDTLKPFWDLQPLINYNYYNPTLWVRDGFLNVFPAIPSSKSGRYFLTPEKAVNDTLFFKFSTSYEDTPSGESYKNLFYDLRTLRDTMNADPQLRPKMTEMLSAMEASSDSVLIVLTSDFIYYNYDHQGRDTIISEKHRSNYFNYNF